VEEIYVWWIGEKEPHAPMIEHVRKHVARAFGVTVQVFESPARPADSYDARRKQHSSTRILRWLLEAGPRGSKVLGVTDADLFIPILTFVFGEAQLGGGAAVVSTARLSEPAPEIDGRLVIERLAKEAVHEMGHAFGLLHCGTPRCAMSRSASVRDVDGKRGELCQDCRSRLRERLAQGRRS
jgi:archaemetzincin